MTILQKIQNLTWWTLDIKLKDILTDLFGRITTLEESEGGGTQDLQSVLETGGYAEFEGGNSFAGILTGDENDREVSFSVASLDYTNASELFISNNEAVVTNTVYNELGDVLNQGSFKSNLGNVEIRQEHNDFKTYVKVLEPIVNSTINIPSPTITGTYTLATLDDLPQVVDDFANDAAAAIGGIAVGELYHTAGVVKLRLI